MSENLSLVLFSLVAAASATALILPLGVALAWRLARWRGPGRSAVEAIFEQTPGPRAGALVKSR